MELSDVKLIEKYSENDPELKNLWEDHILFEKQVEKLTSRPYRTPSEEQSLKLLKKQKLDGKTRLDALLAKYRSMEK